MSSVSGGRVAHRFNNAKRLPVDPHFGSVLGLFPFSGVGTDFVNVGPTPVQSVSFVGAGTYLFQQDTTQTLFGLPTLHIERGAADVVKYLEIIGAAVLRPAGFPLCIEYWFRQSAPLGVGTLIPRQLQFRNASSIGVYGGSSYNFNATAVPGLDIRQSTPTRFVGAPPFTLDEWHFIAWQIVDGLSYVSLDGALIAAPVTADSANAPGWRAQIALGNTPASASNVFSLWLAQMRFTCANRYGDQPAPVPVRPFAVV